MDLSGGFDPQIWIGAVVEQSRDGVEHASGARGGEGGRFLVADLHSQVERRPAFGVREARIGAVIDQERGDVVEAVLNGDEERAAAVDGGLVYVDVRGCEQN